MKRMVIFSMLLLMLFASGCGSSAPEAEEAAVMPTSAISGDDKEQEKPTETPKRKTVDEYLDDFNVMDLAWSDAYAVTTKALAGKEYSKVSVENGWLTFNLSDEETYMYKFYQNPTDQNVLLETKYQPGGNHAVNGIAMVCRASEDFSTWYEFRVSSSNKYSIFFYDKSRKELQDLNPYIELASGVSSLISPAKENLFRAMCNETSLVLEMNGEEVASVQASELMDGGLSGLGAMSYNLTPTIIKFDYFSISTP